MRENYTTMAVTKDARARINAATVRAIGLADRRLSNSEVLIALLDVAERHPDEIRSALSAKADSE